MSEKWLFGYLIKDMAHNPWANVYICFLEHPTYPDAAEDNRQELLRRLHAKFEYTPTLVTSMFTAPLELNVEVKKNTIVFTMSHLSKVRDEILRLYQECKQEMHSLRVLESLGD